MVSPSRKKKLKNAVESEGEDRLSALPDELIHQILKFVNDTKLSVRTSALSKRWKPVWTSLPFLKLENCPQRPSKGATNFARHVLKHRNHQSGVSYLELAYLPPGIVDKFIDYAVSHNVQTLNVYLQKDYKPFKLSKFSCHSIQNLVLRIKFGDVSESDCWDLPALTTLFLWLLPKFSGNNVLPVRCLTCLPALRTLTLMLWDFREPAIDLSLPELTTLSLTMCKMPSKIWNLPALKTLKLYDVAFLGNMSDTFSALVSLQNLTLHMMSMRDCYIPCPQLVNLEIMTHCNDTIEEGDIVVSAPKLTNFTSVGIFPITFQDCELENVNLNLRGWIRRTNIPLIKLKEYYLGFVLMLPGLVSTKILNLQLETIEALSSISDVLVSFTSSFYNLKYVKLPRGFNEASLSTILRNYLLCGSPLATIVAKLPQNTAATSMTAQNVVTEKTLAAPTKLVDSEDIQKTVCVDTVAVGVQKELLVQNSEVHVGAPVEEKCKDQVSSSRGNTDSWLCNEVNSEFVCLLDQIMKKYPETFEHFTTKNKKFCTMKLNMLCTAVNDFTKISMTEVDTEIIVEYRDVFTDLNKLGFNVSWLVNRLNYIEQLWFSQPLLPTLQATDCHNDDAKSELQDLQIRIDDAKTQLQDLQTLRSEKMQKIQKAFGNMDTNLALGCVGDDLLSCP